MFFKFFGEEEEEEVVLIMDVGVEVKIDVEFLDEIDIILFKVFIAKIRGNFFIFNFIFFDSDNESIIGEIKITNVLNNNDIVFKDFFFGVF